ncbi:winged helix-turn-helix domain-containing protein [Methanosarcina sp.]|mgnify:CR=1 FL=1|uniref:winged helix-turn-helix domain-containing protein n=1 Tax=Methanosarcina sp. TaxID=2213 RepID=UPI002D187643|nr:winged helix-turn-helix domain-containing protein [Methanosarcina sp.]HOW13511.1 winged helix-turn-helix domain-containing protein [Methanosarcina sp.]
MTKFVATFHEDNFLAVMPNKMITSAEIAKRIGCSKPTVAVYMEKLVERGKVTRIEIIGGRDAVWQKVV